jgi:hypothetical protein
VTCTFDLPSTHLCPASTTCIPNSLAVDVNGTAWVGVVHRDSTSSRALVYSQPADAGVTLFNDFGTASTCAVGVDWCQALYLVLNNDGGTNWELRIIDIPTGGVRAPTIKEGSRGRQPIIGTGANVLTIAERAGDTMSDLSTNSGASWTHGAPLPSTVPAQGAVMQAGVFTLAGTTTRISGVTDWTTFRWDAIALSWAPGEVFSLGGDAGAVGAAASPYSPLFVTGTAENASTTGSPTAWVIRKSSDAVNFSTVRTYQPYGSSCAAAGIAASTQGGFSVGNCGFDDGGVTGQPIFLTSPTGDTWGPAAFPSLPTGSVFVAVGAAPGGPDVYILGSSPTAVGVTWFLAHATCN